MHDATVAPDSLDAIDLSDFELFRHGFPHHIFDYLREHAPVWRHPKTPGVAAIEGAQAFWVVSRHDDLTEVSRDPDRFRSFEGPRLGGWEERARGQMVITMDPPQHTRQRKLIAAGFTPRMSAKLDDQSRAWAVQIVEEALEKGVVNFVHDVAYQLPMNMIADIVGIPALDRASLFEKMNKQLYAMDPETYLPPEERNMLMGQMLMYAHQLSERKRREPADDIWTKLINAEVEQDGGGTTKLSELELDLFFTVLAVAGSETTRNSIATGLHALLTKPAQLAMLRDDPSLLRTAVEEMIRWTSPVTYFRRTAVADTVLRGQEIKAGEAVTMWYPAANFDPEVFADPFTFDITRNPNPHVAFGGPGPHHCLGANLARREMTIMFEELLARVKDFELLGEPVYSVAGIQSPVTYSLKDLPVRLVAR